MVPILHGKNFTWFNKRVHPSLAKLDKFLFSVQWENRYPGIQQELANQLLDHFFGYQYNGCLVAAVSV